MKDIGDYKERYAEYFQRFNQLAVGEFADLTYGNDQPNDTASSLESIIAYWNYIEKTGVDNSIGSQHILNAGAGASSWMFRSLAMGTKYIVSCCDPHERYLVLVREVCGGIEGSLNIWFHEGMPRLPQRQYNHVYYDYGTIERIPYLGLAIDMAMQSVYVDDVGLKQGAYSYREIVIKLCEAKKLRWFDCEESLDSSNRAGIIIEKP